MNFITGNEAADMIQAIIAEDETLIGLGEIDGSEVEEGPEEYEYEDWQAQWDDDPNPYHGTYSED